MKTLSVPALVNTGKPPVNADVPSLEPKKINPTVAAIVSVGVTVTAHLYQPFPASIIVALT
jgi:hypothetical protein